MNDPIGDEMATMGRAVEAAVRIPPYDGVVRRVRRRRRRRAGAGVGVLAVLAAGALVVLPHVGPQRTGVDPASRVSVAAPTGQGTLALSDVSYFSGSDGMVLGRRCAGTCHDVTLRTTDGGTTYGPEVAVPGSHRYVASGPDLDVAYGPGLAVSADHGATWTDLAPSQPVADIAFTAGTMTVLTTPAGGAAHLWSGPALVTTFRGLRDLGAVPGSDDSARLLVAGSTSFVVSSTGTPRVATYAGGAWTSRPLAVCASGSRPSLSVVTARTWWVACRGQVAGGAEVVASTTDGGGSFTTATPVASPALDMSVAAVSGKTAYLYDGDALWVTRDGGKGWQKALDEPGLGAPHVPPGHDGVDVWVLAPGQNTVWRTTGGGWSGVRLT